MGRLDEDYALLLDNVDSIQANLARNLLDSAGIPSFADELTPHVPGYFAMGFTARMRVFVRHEDVEKAQLLLDKVWDGEAEGQGPEEEG
ncbi:MAG: DUF2007 domain-containing protein [Planctomycetota bacterium]|nr:DUF2007 domain-containing protein [Planctomycetota bacterium]